MAELKIINIPTKYDDKDEEEEYYEAEPEEFYDDDYQPPRKIWLILILIIAIIGAILFGVHTVMKYTDMDVRKEYIREDSKETRYCDFKNNLLKYSTDGVLYTAYSGELIWNYSYDLTNPEMDKCGNYVVVFDKKGSEIDIFSTTGIVKTINTNMPIVDVEIASQGTVAVLMQQNSVSYLQMYDTQGELLVSGEWHPQNGGYPLSMSLSSNGTKLLVSLLDLNDGDVKTTVTFYDFSSKGKEATDNIVASYSYLNMLIPEVDFVEGDKAVAFGENEIILYNNNSQATIIKEIFVDEQMKSVFHNDTHFGFVSDKVLENGEIVNEMTMYNLYGIKCFSTEFTDSYTDIQVMNNKEVLMIDENKVDIYNSFGTHRFSHTFGGNVYTVVPDKMIRRYKVIEETKTEEIQLK